MDLKTQGTQLQSLLGLRFPPVALTFMSEPPPRVDRIMRAAAAGCGYWRLAAEGQVFLTEWSDHSNCPIGAHTHGVDLTVELARELEELIGTMTGIEYLQVEEVSAIPRRNKSFGVAVYSPLTAAPVAPDVVLVRGNPKQMMLLAEAAHAAGVVKDVAARLRPTCAIVPEATEEGRTTVSLGCIGNRVYTELGDDEMYLAIPGPKVVAVLEGLDRIVAANNEMEDFHRKRNAAA
jgi:uncharacterized protein (DUF169 family)